MKVSVDKKSVNEKVREEYLMAMQNEEFKVLVTKLKLTDEEIEKNIFKLYDTLEELNNCKNCKHLYECQNKVPGYVFFPENMESRLNFSYIPCKYKKKALKEEKVTRQTVLDNAKIKDIKITKSRTDVIKWIKNYYDKFDPYKTTKGLYLHGNFGTGKSYLLAALLNELKLKFGVNTEICYVPELLRKLKEDLYLVKDNVYYLENVDILLLDDIGAEKVTEWGRDEILGTIIQTRMNKGMPTFFTSNLTLAELEHHLSITKSSQDSLKAKRILERIKYITDDIELIGNNFREKED